MKRRLPVRLLHWLLDLSAVGLILAILAVVWTLSLLAVKVAMTCVFLLILAWWALNLLDRPAAPAPSEDEPPED